MGGAVLRDVSALGDVLRTILEAASAANAGMLCITPPPAAGWGDMPDAQSAFAAAGFKRHDWLTLLVDLTVDETTLNERLHRSAPKAIRRAKREGLAVERLTDRAELAERFFRVYARFSGIDAETLTARGLATVDADDRCAYTWFVAVDTAGDVAATLGTCRHGGVAMEVMSSRTPDSTAPAQDLLHWEALCHHRAAGDEVFDLAGVSPSPHTAAEAGIRRFKEKWGGSAVAMPRYDIAL